MKLKVLAPFQCPGLLVRTEMPVHDPAGYAEFWGHVQTTWDPLSEEPRAGARDELPDEPPWRGRITTLRCTHAPSFLGGTGSRYRDIDTGSLPRPLHLLEIVPASTALDLGTLFGEALADTQAAGAPGTPELLAPLTRRLQSAPPPVLIRVHDHTIGLIEADLDLGDLLFDLPRGELLRPDRGQGIPVLDHLQQAAITWTERVVEACQSEILDPLFRWILSQPEARQHLHQDMSSYRALVDADEETRPALRFSGWRIGDAGTETAGGRTLWVTRTLLFEPGDGTGKPADDLEACRQAIVHHWLKDVGGGDPPQQVLDDATAHSMRWLNYLFREDAYPAPSRDDDPPNGWRLPPGRPAEPFCRPWEGMLYAQYYYAAFDVLQSRIHQVLAHSFSGESQHHLRDLKEQLDDMVKESTLLILDYQENFKYYQRAVHATVTETLRQWGFETVLLKQVQEAVEACRERVEELHKRATARSSVYTDLILLAIGVTSVFGILLTLLEYGRNLARDPDLTVYERGTFNLVDWIAAHSTDGILLVAGIVSAALVGLYVFFKRRQLL